jgi:hypothetical protein
MGKRYSHHQYSGAEESPNSCFLFCASYTLAVDPMRRALTAVIRACHRSIKVRSPGQTPRVQSHFDPKCFRLPVHRFCSATIRLSSFPAHVTHAAHLAGPLLATCIHSPLVVIVNSAALKMKMGNNNESGALHKTITCTPRHSTLLARQDGLFPRCPNDKIRMTYQ